MNQHPASGWKCQCGGTFRPVQLSEFDFTGYAGIPSTLVNLPGFVCRRCGEKTIPGILIKPSLAQMALEIANLRERLDADKARYLRKQLGLTQQELADRMGIARETVAAWETNKEISPQHDYILRALTVVAIAQRNSFKLSLGVGRRMANLSSALESVNLNPPTSGPVHPIVVESVLRRLRPSARRSPGNRILKR